MKCHLTGDHTPFGLKYISEEGGYVSHCKNGWVHVGEYKNYEKNGKGSVYDHSGRLIYRGSFFNGRPTQKYPSQEDYSAYTFEVINYNNGDKYVGELKNGQRSGHGLYMWENGDAWYGQWKNDTRNGYGIMMYYSGSYDKGTWENGTKVK